MITVANIGWSRYHSAEGPFFGGDFKTLKVPAADSHEPFASKVLATTAAAEGGSWSSINMYDGGLVSVGAMQFIDVAPQFGVSDMLGEVAESCGLEPLLEALRPALDLCGASFSKASGKWRFSHAGATVTTRDQQCRMFFGDAAGNKAGSYTDAKRLTAKTWAACLANVWYVPGAVEAQARYCLRRLMKDFTWGNMRAELFTDGSPGASSDGWLGATRAVLLAYAVNAPAIVSKMYDSGRINGKEKYSPEWCITLLRYVVVNGGVDVWRARWPAKAPLVERAFGVKLPSYQQLVAGSWPALAEPTVVQAPSPGPAEPSPPVPEPLEPIEVQSSDIIEADVEVQDAVVAPEPTVVMAKEPGGLLAFVRMLFEVFARALGRR